MAWVDAKENHVATGQVSPTDLNVMAEDLRILGKEHVLSGSCVGWAIDRMGAGSTRALQNTIVTIGAGMRLVLRRASANFSGVGSGQTYLRLVVATVTKYTAAANGVDDEPNTTLYDNATAGAVQVAVQLCVHNPGSVPAWVNRYDGWCVLLNTVTIP